MAAGTCFAILAACLLGGRVELPEGESPAGVSLQLARTGERLAVTDSTGEFGASLPDSLGPAVLVEFWRGDRLLGVETLLCSRPRSVTPGGRGYLAAPMRVTAAPLELEWEGEAERVETLLADDLRSSSAQVPSLAEAIQQLPGVGAVGRDGFTSAPTIRGLGRERSLLLLEGMRLSADRGVGPSASFLDPLLAGETQILRGTSGVAFGSGAMGGVVLLDLPSPPASPEFTARVSGSSNGGGRAGAFSAAGPVGRGWRAGLAGAARRQDDYRFPAGDGFEEGDAANSGLRSAGGGLVLERPEGARLLRIALIGTTAEEVGRATTQPLRRDWIQDEDHLLASVRLTEEGTTGRSAWTLAAHRPRSVNRAERLDETDNPTRVTWTENSSFDLSAVARVERDRGAATWLWGLDIFTRWNVDAVERGVEHEGMEPPVETALDLVTDARRGDVGAYLGWKCPVREVGEFLATGRLDWAGRGAEGRPDVSWLAPSLDLRLLYPLDARWAVSLGAGRAFRAPRIQELYFAGDRPGGSRLANPDLEPEMAWAGECGLHWGRETWRGSATVWAMAAEDFIAQLPVDAGGDTLQFRNVTRGRLLGAELSVSFEPISGGGKIELAYAAMRGEDRHGAPLPDMPSGELRVAGGFRLAGPAEAPRASATASLRLGAAKTPIAEGASAAWWSDFLGATGVGGDEVGHRGYARADLGLRLRPHPRITCDATVTNLLDARYLDRPEPDAYPQPGRAVMLQLTTRL